MDRETVDRLNSFSLTLEEKDEVSLEERDIAKGKAECEHSLIGKFFGEKKEDKVRVLKGRTRSFNNQYLILREWEENILENIDFFKTVELWIQVWKLPYHWIGLESGRKIGKKFDNCVDVVVPETCSSKGRYLKILVELNLDKPLLRGTNIRLGTKIIWVDFRYENLQSFCFYCGWVGHIKRGCQARREDIKTDKLIEGQFGEWLRATELYTSKGNQKPLRANSPIKKMTQQRCGLEHENKSQSMDIPNTSNVQDKNLEDKIREETSGSPVSVLTPSSLVVANSNADFEILRTRVGNLDSPRARWNKENGMHIDNLEMVDLVVQMDGKRTPFKEIQYTTKMKGNFGKKYQFSKRGGRPKRMRHSIPTLMETTPGQEVSTCGYKRQLDLAYNEMEALNSGNKKLKPTDGGRVYSIRYGLGHTKYPRYQ
ncbi:hypothetical protein DH2020_012521 [Rehmannia glutinosa]|uniref:CCHC-type domain-containing protein n=1 Tax=Rehmannia glutinosa TaxID=99300 RepID=A0ABR0WZK4_REHGL